jgi:hypothetical protein
MFASKASFSPDVESATPTPAGCGTRVLDRLAKLRDRITGLNIPKFLKTHFRKMLLLAAGISATVVTFVILGELRSYAANQRVDSAVLTDSVWDQPIPVHFNATDPAS